MCVNGFVKLNRCKETEELLTNDPDCFLLLTLIAYRAKRTSDFSALGLKVGEALVGDFKACGLTERRYRTSKDKLEKWGFATFKATNKGTIATLCNSAIYDINVETSDEQRDRRATSKRRASDEQATTNKKEKKVRSKEDKEKIYSLHQRCVTEFCSFYESKFKTKYVFNGGKDGSNLKHLIGNIKTKCSEAGLAEDDETVFQGFCHFLQSINDDFVLKNFSISLINSKFNELFKNAKNGTSKNKAGTSDYSDYIAILNERARQ